MNASSAPGRTCPLSYRYRPEAIALEVPLAVDTLWVAGGLYGNPFALRALLEAYDAEPGSKALIFNGDFHWFDVDPAHFRLINQAVLAFRALRGNVETELSSPAESAGCGCAYPQWVGEATVTYSNRIIERLRATARESGIELARLATLPMHLAGRVGNLRVGIVHGDGESLAGWAFSQEALATRDGCAAARALFARAEVDVFASTHTCLPVLQVFQEGTVLVNNGAAGMPNFAGRMYGLASRISLFPNRDAVYSIRQRGVFIEAIPLRYDSRAWQECFLAQWPAGSDAHRSYWDRIVSGPRYEIEQALRLNAFLG
jgi:hypothetical protein